MLEHLQNSPQDCPFDFHVKNYQKSYLVHGQDNWRVSLNGMRSTNNLYKDLAFNVWHSVTLDDITVEDGQLNDNVLFLERYKYKDLRLSNIRSIVIDDQENTVKVLTRNLKKVPDDMLQIRRKIHYGKNRVI